MAVPLFELSGLVVLLTAPIQATKKRCYQNLIIQVKGKQEAGEGLVKFEFEGNHLALLTGIQLGDEVTVGFLVRGVDYYWEGATKYLVVLQGRELWVTPTPAKRRAKPAASPPLPAAALDEQPPF